MQKAIQQKIRFETVSLGTYVKVVGGFAFKSEFFSSEGTPLVRISDIKNDSIFLTEAARIPTEKIGRGQDYRVEPGDILIAMSGATTGKIGVVPDDCVQPVLQNQRVGNFKVIEPNKVDKKYLKHYLVSSSYQYQIWQTMAGVAQPNISSRQLEQIEIPLPPIAQQKRIAAILDKAEEIRGLRRRALGELDAIVQSIFLEMFGDLTSVTEKNEYSLLTGCIKCKLGEQITLQRGFDITKDQCCEGTYPVISSGGISAYHAEYKACGPGVLLGRKGSVGRVHYVEEDYWPHDTTLWVKDFKENNPIFVYYFFKRFPISDFEESTSNPTLNRNRLHPVNVFWPPLSLQQKFARRVEAIEQLKATHRESLAHLNALFASLQHRAFRGEL